MLVLYSFLADQQTGASQAAREHVGMLHRHLLAKATSMHGDQRHYGIETPCQEHLLQQKHNRRYHCCRCIKAGNPTCACSEHS